MVKGHCCKLPKVFVLELVVQMLALVMLHTGLCICLLILFELLVKEEEEVRLDIPGLVLLALE